ncbi:MAG: glycosyltransferase, partial [Pseudomonadota bacterium]
MDVSLIVVSRNRTSDLVRLCDVLKHQFGLVFQLIIVTNSDQEIVKSALGSFPATVVCMDVANISMMRNAGLAQALGRVIAFCDDDCIPEPDWLARLIQPLLDGLADAATGAVFGRNGCTPQWDMVWSGRDGLDLHSDPLPQDTQYFSGTADRFVKLQGTNFAVLKAKLDALGGFDPAYAYYLDDTDLSLRLAQNGARIAFVPEARVHHLFEANQTRFRSRAPRSLSVIGA